MACLQRFRMLSLLLFLSVAACSAFDRRQSTPQYSRCRFSLDFSQDQLVHNSTDFEANVFYWDGQFHQDGIGYDQSTGVTIDHVLLGYATGLPAGPPDMFSNARNEAYHVMLLTHAIAGSSHASTFVYSANPADAAERAVAILNTKLATYKAFNNTYPGYGGFLPTFEIFDGAIGPVNGSIHTVSAVDNGYLIWALYSLIQVLEASPIAQYRSLSVRWADYLIQLRLNVKEVFLRGPGLGSICATSTLLPEVLPYASTQKYACESNADTLNDPYSGELMAWFITYSGIGYDVEHAIWSSRRPQLRAANYTGSIVDVAHAQGAQNYSGAPIVGRHIIPITTQKGLYFGAQEHLKLLFLPYLDVPIVQRVMRNAERVRTCNSVLMDSTPGLFAGVTNPTSPTEQYAGYVWNAGVPSVATQQLQELDIITPYAAFPTILLDRGVGLSWYHNVLDAKCMQSVYGSVNSIRRDGSSVSRIVSWETKAPILLALLGGIKDFVRDALKVDGALTGFLTGVAYEYGLVFDETMNGGIKLMGEDVPLCLPVGKVSGLGLRDYSTCSSMQ